jgi:transglutaminase-like putative cysteine protease
MLPRYRGMKLAIHARLDYRFDAPADVLLQLEAAANIPEQSVEASRIDLSPHSHFARVAAQDSIGERLWLRVEDRLTVDYQATVAVDRIVADWESLAQVPPHRLPGETVQYLMGSRYCPSDTFQPFVDATFAGLEGGTRITAICDWVAANLRYVPGASNAATTAADTFIRREGVCRDYAHLVITLARASAIPARIASVYALGVKPQDFHAVAEVFVGGEWHLVDATGMAEEPAMAKIGIGRDAADVSFLTTYGNARFVDQAIDVRRCD